MHTRINSCWTLGVCMAFTSLISGCHYYKPVTQAVPVYSESTAESVENWEDRRIFLLHPGGAYLLDNVEVNLKERYLEALLSKFPTKHSGYSDADRKKYRYNPSADDVLKEMYLYTDSAELGAVGDRIKIPLAEIQKIEVIERDKEKSTQRTVVASLGFLLGITVLIAFLSFRSGFSMGF